MSCKYHTKYKSPVQSDTTNSHMNKINNNSLRIFPSNVCPRIQLQHLLSIFQFFLWCSPFLLLCMCVLWLSTKNSTVVFFYNNDKITKSGSLWIDNRPFCHILLTLFSLAAFMWIGKVFSFHSKSTEKPFSILLLNDKSNGYFFALHKSNSGCQKLLTLSIWR